MFDEDQTINNTMIAFPSKKYNDCIEKLATKNLIS